MRIISQWKFDNDSWGIALFCVFGGRFTYGIVICGYVFEWERGGLPLDRIRSYQPPEGSHRIK